SQTSTELANHYYDFCIGPRSSGYFRDAETGNDYADQRYMSPGTGRFITPDPFSTSAMPKDPGSWNKYTYTRGDPINRVDPGGADDTDPDCIGDICILIDSYASDGSGGISTGC